MIDQRGKVPSGREIKVYGARWPILILYIVSCASSTLQWIQYSIIADTTMRYYGVSYTTVDWAAMIYLLTFAMFCLVGSYLLDVLGLRIAFLIGMAGTCLGAWIKLWSVSPDKFWLVIVGQGIVGLSEVVMMPVPPKLAAAWFGPKEVSTACSLGLLGVQAGIAVGFIIPPMLIDSQGDAADIERGLYIMLTIIAIVDTILLIILYMCFKGKPPSPPSPAQLRKEEKQMEHTNFKQTLKDLLTNRSYMLLVLSHGTAIGFNYAILQLLNQIILTYYPNASVDAGRIGLIIIIVGMVNMVVCGVALDSFRKFRATVTAVHVSTIISMVIFTFTLDKGIVFVYLSSALLGFCMSGYMPTGCELAAELTYPAEESTSAGILLTSAQVFGILFTYIYSYISKAVGIKITNLVMIGVLSFGMSIIFCIKFDLRRQKVQEENKNDINRNNS